MLNVIDYLGEQWHDLVNQVAEGGNEAVRPQSCHVRALLTPLQQQLQAGEVSKAIFILREIQTLEKASCDHPENPANKQFCTSSQDLVPVIGKMVNECKIQPVIDLIIKSVEAVKNSVKSP